MTVGPLSVVRDAAPGSPNPHNLMLGDRLAQCISDHEATRIEAQLANDALRILATNYAPNIAEMADEAAAEREAERLDVADQFTASGTYPYDDDGYCCWCGNGHWKAGHGPECPIPDLMNRGTLRIVDVGGTGLPRWPDLTELREAVNARDEADGTAEQDYAALHDVCAAARRLCYPDSDT